MGIRVEVRVVGRDGGVVADFGADGLGFGVGAEVATPSVVSRDAGGVAGGIATRLANAGTVVCGGGFNRWRRRWSESWHRCIELAASLDGVNVKAIDFRKHRKVMRSNA